MTHEHGYDKQALGKRLRRIEGQVRGLEKMVDDDRYCMDLLTQIAAVSKALESVALEVLDEHVRHCVAGALAAGDERAAAEKSDELLAAVQRFARTR
jgi:CsoR family transcriptional regulator, copper-sensing transcriptional repressor